MAKDPGERYPSAGAFSAALAQLRDIGSWTEADAGAWWQARGERLRRGPSPRDLALERTAAQS